MGYKHVLSIADTSCVALEPGATCRVKFVVNGNNYLCEMKMYFNTQKGESNLLSTG